MSLFAGAYQGASVLVTGHTGFKGSWLVAWLNALGARVTGYALPPSTTPNHWQLLGAKARDEQGDIRELERFRAVVRECQPDIVFHLAAQPLVRRSYRDPLETWSTNVMGTANLLDSCRDLPGLKAIVVITTDKVYANQEWPWGYRENERLGGHDPYSASKAAVELLCDSYRNSFFPNSGPTLLATARAGNVIGGGDWSQDRLLPDIVRAVGQGQSLEIRSPNATRPWQHVLDCLSGYLLLGQRLLGHQAAFAEAWNFGPDVADNRSVHAMLQVLGQHWPELKWHLSAGEHPHEAGLLYLDNSKAKRLLDWQPVWDLQRALAATAQWYSAHTRGELLTQAQIAAFVAAAQQADCAWARA